MATASGDNGKNNGNDDKKGDKPSRLSAGIRLEMFLIITYLLFSIFIYLSFEISKYFYIKISAFKLKPKSKQDCPKPEEEVVKISGINF